MQPVPNDKCLWITCLHDCALKCPRSAGHGHFLKSWEGSAFAALSRKCCSSLLVPPMEKDLPIYADQVLLTCPPRNWPGRSRNAIHKATTSTSQSASSIILPVGSRSRPSQLRRTAGARRPADAPFPPPPSPPQDVIPQRLRNYVSNGNTLILTGGDRTSARRLPPPAPSSPPPPALPAGTDAPLATPSLPVKRRTACRQGGLQRERSAALRARRPSKAVSSVCVCARERAR